jgi:hypothetical protein
MEPYPYAEDPYPEDYYADYPGNDQYYQDQEYRPEAPRRKKTVDVWMDQPTALAPRIKRRSVALFLCVSRYSSRGSS